MAAFLSSFWSSRPAPENRQCPQPKKTREEPPRQDTADVAPTGITFFPPFVPCPNPHGTDEFVRATLIEQGGSQRAALRAWNDISRASRAAEPSSPKPKGKPPHPKSKANNQPQAKPLPTDCRESRATESLREILRNSVEPSQARRPQTAAAVNPSMARALGPMATNLIQSPSCSSEESSSGSTPSPFPAGGGPATTRQSATARTLFRTSFPHRGAHILAPPKSTPLGLISALSAIRTSMTHIPALAEIKTPSLRAMESVHAQYIRLLAREGRHLSPYVPEETPFSPESLAGMLHNLVSLRDLLPGHPTIRTVGLGIICEDDQDEGHVGRIICAGGPPDLVVWIYFDSATDGRACFDREGGVYTRLAGFAALKPVPLRESRFSWGAEENMGVVRELAWRSEVKMLKTKREGSTGK